MRNVPLQLMLTVGGVVAASLSFSTQALATTATANTIPTYSGSCPTTIPFRGTIAGKAGSTITYAFLFFDPGQGKVITDAGASAKLGSNGSVDVTGKGTFSGSGNAWMQVAVESPDSSFSNTVSFTVDCGAAAHSGLSSARSAATTVRTMAGAAVSATPPPLNFILEFTIWTGSDDLRSDSYVTALGYNAQKNTFGCLLKSDHADSWDNNSVHTVPCPGMANVAPADLLSTLKKMPININMDRYGGPWDIITKTQDNWNIQRVLVKEYEPGSGKEPVCLFDVRGDPLRRLTGSEPSVTLTNYISHC